MVSAKLSEPVLTATPGGVVGCDLHLRNPGPAPLAVRVEPRGRAGKWAVVRPAKVAVAAGAEASARLTFTVPDSAALVAGETIGFTVRVVGERSVDVPGTIEIAERRDVRLAIHPLLSQDRRQAQHTVVVANRGNVAALVTLGVEAGGAVDVALSSQVVVVEAGREARVDAAVAARRRWFGRRARPHRVVVRGERDDGPSLDAAATFFQSPIRWKLPVAACLAGLLLVAVAAAGMGGRTDAPPAPAAAAPVELPSNCPAGPADAGGVVPITLFAFCPSTVTVAAGQDVRWRNDDAVPHSATFDGFDTGVLGQGQSAGIRFEQPGTYRYFCKLHPGMQGTVVVTA